MRLTAILVTIITLACNSNKNSAQSMKQVANLLKQQVQQDKSPSVHYVFFNKDSILFEQSEGYANVHSKLKMDGSITFNAYSLTKTFTAVAILQLVESKMLALDSSVLKYLPESGLKESVTVRHLLSHTSGLSNPLPLGWIHLSSEHDSFNRDAFFRPILEKHAGGKSEPGRKFRYTNLGYIVLGQLIEKVTGMGYEDYISKNIIQRLGGDGELGFENSINALHASGYHDRRSFSMLLLGFMLDKKKYMGAPDGRWKPFRDICIHGTPYGGMIGNAQGFVRFGQELLTMNSVLLGQEMIQAMWTENKTSDGKNTGMCLGWFTGNLNGNRYYCHAGGGGGFYCELRLYPEIDSGSFIIFNRSGFSDERFLDNLDLPLIEMSRQLDA